MYSVTDFEESNLHTSILTAFILFVNINQYARLYSLLITNWPSLFIYTCKCACVFQYTDQVTERISPPRHYSAVGPDDNFRVGIQWNDLMIKRLQIMRKETAMPNLL